MSLPVINQKEYLKKYLSLGSDDKKKKKRKKTVKTERFQVVDDDIDLKNMQPLEDGDYNLYELAEDAPQIAGFIDERPDEVKSLEVFRSSKWKIIQDEHGIEDIKVTEEHLTKSKSITSRSYDKEILPPHSDETDSKHGKHKEKRVNSELDGGRCSRTYDDDDESPPRKALADEDSDESPPRNSRNYTVSSASSGDVNKNFHRKKEFSPSRKHGNSDRNRSYKTDSDESPPRTSRVKGGVTEPSLRKSNFDASSDESQQRNSRFKYDSDESQERSRDKHRQTSARYYKRENFKNIQMQGSRGDRGDSDEAPPRKKNARRVQADSDESPPRKRNHQSSRWDRGNSDESPPRKMDAKGNRRVQAESHEPHSKKGNAQVSRTSQVHSDESPPRKRNAQHSRRNQGDSDESPPRKKGTQANRKVQEDSDESPPRKRDSSLQGKLSRHFHHGSGDEKSVQPRSKHDSNIDRGSNMKRMEKQERTLDGKKAGLQDSKALRMENMEHNLREKEMFSKMSDEMSGRNAAPILRDRATGRKRDLAREAEEKEAEKEKENEKKQKYSRWGKGLKQVEDQQSRLAEDLYEMSKPLARYADDKDLEQHLKEQEREGDPMQEYIQNSRMKREKENKGKDGEIKEKYPVYKGPQPPPNRFGIRPGYRWDGVDRSTGYEHKWFQEKNARKALQEEAYKWSTEDM